jgi:23S rRNA (pseudouridine1915-N3)-methyltransferase
MRIRMIAVGQKMPQWVEVGFNEYAKRIVGDCQLELLELPMSKRSKNSNVEQLKAKEADAITACLRKDELVIALDVLGKAVSTEDLALQMSAWQMQGHNIALIIGGPDGICRSVLEKAQSKISLSKLTLPHPLVRVLVAEQLYRAWSINKGHPYHR